MKPATSSLINALTFVSLAQREKGAPYQTHAQIRNKQIIACDGVLTAGHAVEEDLQACPHTFSLLNALKTCKGVLSVTQPDNHNLMVKAGRFKAFIACMPDAVLPDIVPDPVCGQIDDRIRTGLALLSPFILENSQRVITASALIGKNTIQATTGTLILEYWHGIDMPPNLIVPKVFINALCKIQKSIVSFGFSQTSFTVYFDDGAWLKTQLYKDKWPDFGRILDVPNVPINLPENFFEGLNSIANFIDDNRLRIRPNGLQTHTAANLGATYDIEGLNANLCLNFKTMQMLEDIIKSIDMVGVNGITYFYGENIRGAISQIKE